MARKIASYDYGSIAGEPKLLAFYKSLDADQKEKFDRFRNRRDRE